MRVGFTYDLRSDWLAEGYSLEETAEFDSEKTVAALEEAIARCGFTVERIGGVKALAAALTAGRRWDFVFNIAEGMHGYGREAQVPALLDAWRIPYTFSEPLALSTTLHKGVTKALLRDAGVTTTASATIAHLDELDRLTLPWPRFLKPVAEGTSKGVGAFSLVRDEGAQRETAAMLLSRFSQPVLVEPFLSGREFTVGVLGTGRHAEALGVREVVFHEGASAPAYTHDAKIAFVDSVEYRTPDDDEAQRAVRLALDAWRALGCRDAGRVDVRSDGEGVPHVIEVNPLAGLSPGFSDLSLLGEQAGLSHHALIEKILRAATRRMGIAWPE